MKKLTKLFTTTFMALVLLMVAPTVVANPGDHELVTGSYTCRDFVSGTDNQNLYVTGTIIMSDFGNMTCRGSAPTNCASDAAATLSSLDARHCSTSLISASTPGSYTDTRFNFVCEGTRKEVIEAVVTLADQCSEHESKKRFLSRTGKLI